MTVRRWFPFAAAAIVLAVAACAGIAANQGGGASTTAPSSPVVETTTLPAAAPTSAVATPTPLTRTIGPGVAGGGGTPLPQRPLALGFDPRPPPRPLGPAPPNAGWGHHKLVLGLSG